MKGQESAWQVSQTLKSFECIWFKEVLERLEVLRAGAEHLPSMHKTLALIWSKRKTGRVKTKLQSPLILFPSDTCHTPCHSAELSKWPLWEASRPHEGRCLCSFQSTWRAGSWGGECSSEVECEPGMPNALGQSPRNTRTEHLGTG